MLYFGCMIFILFVGIGLFLIYHLFLSDVQGFFATLAPAVWQFSMYAFLLAGGMIMLALISWMIAHKIHRGFRYAWSHFRILSAVKKAMLESGVYIKEGVGKSTLARLPQMKLTFSDDLVSAVLTVENHPRLDKTLDTLALSSCLKHYVVDQHYQTENLNTYVYELSDSRKQKQMAFHSVEDFMEYSQNRCGDYELFLDDVSTIPLGSALLCGVTGSGKTFSAYSLVLQILGKSVPHSLFVGDPKGSSLAVLGEKISKENTAEDVHGIIELLDRFHSEMQQRKIEIKDRLHEKLDATYADFDLPAKIFVCDEYSSLIGYIGGLDKKTRDDFMAKLKAVIMQGRQLGFFLWILMQKSDATTIPTDIRDNLVCKIVLGSAPRTTYDTAIGTEAAAHIPVRKFLAGQGVFTCDGITHKGHPKLCNFPTLSFDILGAVKKLSRGGSLRK